MNLKISSHIHHFIMTAYKLTFLIRASTPAKSSQLVTDFFFVESLLVSPTPFLDGVIMLSVLFNYLSFLLFSNTNMIQKEP